MGYNAAVGLTVNVPNNVTTSSNSAINNAATLSFCQTYCSTSVNVDPYYGTYECVAYSVRYKSGSTVGQCYLFWQVPISLCTTRTTTGACSSTGGSYRLVWVPA